MKIVLLSLLLLSGPSIFAETEAELKEMYDDALYMHTDYSSEEKAERKKEFELLVGEYSESGRRDAQDSQDVFVRIQKFSRNFWAEISGLDADDFEEENSVDLLYLLKTELGEHRFIMLGKLSKDSVGVRQTSGNEVQLSVRIHSMAVLTLSEDGKNLECQFYRGRASAGYYEYPNGYVSGTRAANNSTFSLLKSVELKKIEGS